MTVKKAMVLGGGMVGAAAAADLARTPGFEVTLVDASPQALERAAARGLRTQRADLGDPGGVARRRSGGPGARRAAERPGATDAARRDRRRQALLRHQLHARGRAGCWTGWRRSAASPPWSTAAWRPACATSWRAARCPCSTLRQQRHLRGRPAGGASLALRVPARLLAGRRDRGVHPSRAPGGARPARSCGRRCRSWS